MKQTKMENAKILAELSSDQQAEVFRRAARLTEPRSIRGKTSDRFYSGECGLSRKTISAMRDEGHGEKIMMGSGANSGRWYFPIEILERAAESIKSSHARMALIHQVRQRPPRTSHS